MGKAVCTVCGATVERKAAVVHARRCAGPAPKPRGLSAARKKLANTRVRCTGCGLVFWKNKTLQNHMDRCDAEHEAHEDYNREVEIPHVIFINPETGEQAETGHSSLRDLSLHQYRREVFRQTFQS